MNARRTHAFIAALAVLALASCSDDNPAAPAPPAPNPLDRYVNQATGDDANTGKSGSPWETITYAVATADSDITIHVAPGTYDDASGETFPITLKKGQTLVGDVANQGAGATPTLIRGEAPYTASSLVAGATVVGAWYARVAGFSIESVTTPLNYAGIAIDGVDMEIDHNTFRNATYSGVNSGYGANVDVHDNLFQSSSYGVFVDGSGIVTIHDNTMEMGVFGVRCFGIDSLDVAHNMINTTRQGVQWGGGLAANIHDNTFNSPTGYEYGGVSITAANSVVRHNTFLTGPGVYVFDFASVPDVGTAASPGLNDFSAIVGVALVHHGSGTVMAIGNTWANTPPQVGVDIVIDGGGSVVTE